MFMGRADNIKIIVERIEPKGVGAHISFWAIKEKIGSGGFIDLAHKKPLPKCLLRRGSYF